jgi:hypothetical protein
MLRKGVLLVSGDDNKFKPVKDVQSFPLKENFHLELVKKLVGRVVLNSQEGVRDVHQQESPDFIDNVDEEKVEVLSCEVD